MKKLKSVWGPIWCGSLHPTHSRDLSWMPPSGIDMDLNFAMLECRFVSFLKFKFKFAHYVFNSFYPALLIIISYFLQSVNPTEFKKQDKNIFLLEIHPLWCHRWPDVWLRPPQLQQDAKAKHFGWGGCKQRGNNALQWGSVQLLHCDFSDEQIPNRFETNIFHQFVTRSHRILLRRLLFSEPLWN